MRKIIIIRDYVGNSADVQLDNLYTLVEVVQETAVEASPIIGNEASTTKVPFIKAILDYLVQGWHAIIPAKTTEIHDTDKVIFFNTTDDNKTKTRTWAQLVAQLATLFQPKLTAGTNISILDNVISVRRFSTFKSQDAYVSTPVADTPFILETIKIDANKFASGSTILLEVDVLLARTGSGSGSATLNLSTSPTAVGNVIGTFQSIGSSLGTGFERTFVLKPASVIEGFPFGAAQATDRTNFGGSILSSKPWFIKNTDMYFHVVVSGSTTSVQFNTSQFSIQQII